MRWGSRSDLRDLRIIVVEDEPLVRMDVEEFLADHGAVVAASCGTLADALAQVERVQADVAIVDLVLAGEIADPLISTLIERGTPTLVVTGYDEGSLALVDHPLVSILTKPADPPTLFEALALLSRPPGERPGHEHRADGGEEMGDEIGEFGEGIGQKIGPDIGQGSSQDIGQKISGFGGKGAEDG